MADMIAGPQHHIVAECGERLDHIGLEDEGVPSDREGGIGDGFRADIARQGVAGLLHPGADIASVAVDFRVSDGHEQIDVFGCMAGLQVFERHQRLVGEMVAGSVHARPVHRIPDNLSATVMGEVEPGEFGEGANPEDDHRLAHGCPPLVGSAISGANRWSVHTSKLRAMSPILNNISRILTWPI